MDKKVGIIGYGWVGKAMYKLFPKARVISGHSFIGDDGVEQNFSPEAWNEVKETYQAAINECDIVFICVPTPCPNGTRLDVSAVEEAVAWCKADLLVIRSTVNPGDCDFFRLKYEKNIVMQPEYLGETPAHPLLDTIKTPWMIIGGEKKQREKLIELYASVYNSNVHIRQVSTYAAEIIKLTENRAILFKAAQMQELYDVCKAHDIDYYTVRDAVYGDDPRFDLWFSFVYPWKRGVISKCIPKDVYAWCAWAESAGYTPKITQAILEKNEEWIALNQPKVDPKVQLAQTVN